MTLISFFKKRPRWRYFNPDEKTGRYGTIDDLSTKLVDLLDEARHIAGIPFVITSGYRTVEQNKKIGGAPTSSHLRGLAADLRVRTNSQRMAIVNACIRAGFNRFGVYDKHVHVDIDPDKAQNTMWVGKSK